MLFFETMVIFIIPGAVVPKARPRVTRNGTYMPPKYAQWKASAIALIQAKKLERVNPPYKIRVVLVGSHRGDVDNMAGSVLDALVQAGTIEGDSSNIVRELAVCRLESKKHRHVQVTIMHSPKIRFEQLMKQSKS